MDLQIKKKVTILVTTVQEVKVVDISKAIIIKVGFRPLSSDMECTFFAFFIGGRL